MLRGLCSFFLICLITQLIHANPSGGEVTSGSATIDQSGNNTVINQTTDKAIINWQSFNINANESTHFQQPNAGSITLNRINPGQGMSAIYGRLTATGRIILVNQSGVFLGPTAFVNVGSIIISTANISDQNFLAGKYIFDQASTQHGVIINRGTIQAANHGLIALVGSNVSNEGYIQANLGTVILASGDKFTVDLGGDGLINFSVDAESTGSGRDVSGKIMRDGVNNSGTIVADGGKILMSAKEAQGVVDHAINMSGVAQAHSVAQNGGTIILSSNSNVKVSGRIDVSGTRGGKVKIIANRVHITPSAIINANGDIAGGKVIIKANESVKYSGTISATGYQGGVVKILADKINVTSMGKIDVSGINQGGSVTIASRANRDGEIKYSGSISANGFKGGFVRIIADKINVTSMGKIDVSGTSEGGSVVIASRANHSGEIKYSGSITANGFKGGFVKILADKINVTSMGKIDVSGTSEGGSVTIASRTNNNSEIKYSGSISANGFKGGFVKILADSINVGSLAKIDVSGLNQGGEVLIGGNAHGAGPEKNAKQTTVEKGAVILADAINMGNGGRVIIWSDIATTFNGTISARGGKNGGDGGFVETSGKHLDIADANINLSAPHGKIGTWLLDPINVVIQVNGNTNVNGNNNNGVFTPTGNDSIFDVNQLLLALNNANIIIQTGSFGNQEGNIIINSPITWNSGASLTLNAANAIIINFNVNAPHGSLFLNAGNYVQFNSTPSVGGTLAANTNQIYTSQKQQIVTVMQQATPQYLALNTPAAPYTLDYLNTVAAQPYTASPSAAKMRKQIEELEKQTQVIDTIQVGEAKIACNRAGSAKLCDTLDISMN